MAVVPFTPPESPNLLGAVMATQWKERILAGRCFQALPESWKRKTRGGKGGEPGIGCGGTHSGRCFLGFYREGLFSEGALGGRHDGKVISTHPKLN